MQPYVILVQIDATGQNFKTFPAQGESLAEVIERVSKKPLAEHEVLNQNCYCISVKNSKTGFPTRVMHEREAEKFLKWRTSTAYLRCKATCDKSPASRY